MEIADPFSWDALLGAQPGGAIPCTPQQMQGLAYLQQAAAGQQAAYANHPLANAYAQGIYMTDQGALKADSEEHRACVRLQRKRAAIQRRGNRMETRLERRRKAIRAKWNSRLIGGTLVAIGAPLLVAVIAAAWKTALWVILQ